MRKRRQAITVAVYLLPFLVLFTVFVVFPIGYGFWISMHRWHVLDKSAAFVGLGNYRNVLEDDLFAIALARTALFVLLTVPAGNLVSLLMAVGLNQNYRGQAIYRVCFYLPVVTSVSVVAVLWRWLYSTEFGLINLWLGVKLPWLSNPNWVMPSLAILSIWWGAGGNMLIYLAGLRAIPKETLEAAAIDGSTGLRRFWSVTLPGIRPSLVFCFVMSVIASSQVFGQTYIMTGGGPNYSSLTVILYMYQQGFGQYQLGYACAVAYILFLIVVTLAALQFWLFGPRRRRLVQS
jgi:multiple sugar transport system permease protein